MWGGGICKGIKLWNAQGLPVINSPPPPPGIATVRLTKNLSSRHISAQVSKQLDETASINFQHSQIRSCYRPVAHVSTTTNMGKTTLSITEVETIKTHIQHSLIFVNVLTQHFCILLTSWMPNGDGGCRSSVNHLKSRYKQNNRSEYLIVKTTKK